MRRRPTEMKEDPTALGRSCSEMNSLPVMLFLLIVTCVMSKVESTLNGTFFPVHSSCLLSAPQQQSGVSSEGFFHFEKGIESLHCIAWATASMKERPCNLPDTLLRFNNEYNEWADEQNRGCGVCMDER
eukprot:1138873-Pelagomonas_calceolata.AAC.1